MLIAGNWKMNLKYEDIINFKDIISDFKLDNRVKMAIFPQFPLLYSAKKIFQIIILKLVLKLVQHI